MSATCARRRCPRTCKHRTHRVSAIGTLLYPSADVKACPVVQLSLNAMLAVAEIGPAFARLEDGSFVPVTPHRRA